MAVMAELEAIVTADTSGFDSAMTTSGQKVDELGTKGQSAGANFGAASAAMAVGAAGITAGIADAVMMAGDFEAAMNGIQSVTGATTAEMEALSAMALQVGQDTSFSAQEGADAISELGKAGIPIPDILNGAAMATASLAAAGEVDMARAAEVMSAAMNVFQLEGAEAANVADILAAGANTSASSINDLALGMQQAGPAAAGLGMDLQSTVASLALLADYGLSGSNAGTQLKIMLNSLTPATKPAREEFERLGLAVGESGNAFFNAQGEFVGMEQATVLLYDALKGLTDAERSAALATIFGSEAAGAAEIMFQNQKAAVEGSGKSFSDYVADVQPAGQATKVAAAKMAGMNGALDALSGSIDTAKIAFGMAFLPVVEQVAEGLASLVNVFIGLPPEIQTVVSVVAAGAAAFLAVGAAIGFIIGPMGAAIGLLGPVAAGFALIAAPLALVVAGLVLLKKAYDENLGGFADAVNTAVADITAAFQPVLDVIGEVVAAFQEGGLTAAIDTFLAGIPRIQDAVGNLAAIFGDLAARAIPALVEAFRGIDWTAVGDAIGTGLQGALAALSNFGAWVLAAISGGAGGGGGAGSLAGDITAWLAARFSEIDWAQLGTALLDGAKRAAALLLDFAQWGLDRLGEIAVFVLNAVTGADWASISTALQTKGQEFVTGLLTGIDAKSAELFTWFNEVGPKVLEAIGDLASLLLSKGVELIGGLFNGITQKWPEVDDWIQNVGPDVLVTIGDLLTTLVQKGGDLISGLWQGIQDKWPEVTAWLGLVATAALEATPELIETLLQKGTDLISGLWQGITDKWPEVTIWLGEIATNALAVVPDLLSTLLNKGTDLIAGLFQGITDKWPDVTDWFGGIPGAVLAVIPDLGTTLFSAGQSIIQGFIDGILSMAGAVGGAVQSITDQAGQVNAYDPSKPGGGLDGGGGGESAPRDATQRNQKAAGGPVYSNMAYWVGERGPEPFIPAQNGRILSHADSMAALSGGGGQTITQIFHIAKIEVASIEGVDEWIDQKIRMSGTAAGRGV